jgi:hypothetical protein
MPFSEHVKFPNTVAKTAIAMVILLFYGNVPETVIKMWPHLVIAIAALSYGP